MLTRLEVRGFKNLLDLMVEFGPFTCIAGGNGTGKSNVFDAIQFLSLLADRSMIGAAQEVRDTHGERHGDARDLFWNGYADGEHRMSFAAEMIVPREVEDDIGRAAEPSSTFLRYELELGYQPPRGAEKVGRLTLRREDLSQIKPRDAADHLRFAHSAKAFRGAVVIGRPRSTTPYISTIYDEGETIVRIHHGMRGQTRPAPALRTPTTMLSTINRSDDPTILAARREMQSWRRLALEPTALRTSDRYTDPVYLEPNGLHLPATLHRIARQKSPDDLAQVYSKVAGRLSDLSGLQVRTLDVDDDDKRELLTIRLREINGTNFSARNLSEGTLRFLALCVLLEDPEVLGLICMEEPENGIHPGNLNAVVELVRDLAVDPDETPGEENPFRQVLINTHSPGVVQLVDEAGPSAAPAGRHLAGQRGRKGLPDQGGHSALPDRPARGPACPRCGDRMTLRTLYLCESSSDAGLKVHIEEIAAEAGYALLVTVPDFDRLLEPTGSAVADKLRVARRLADAEYDIALIHRDADNVQPQRRCEEIGAAIAQEWPGLAHVPIIPVRMSEAWLLVDEAAIREVAGNPKGRAPLGLPKPAKVETEPDPKQRLKDAIATASGAKGREPKKLQARFPQNRHRLVQMLDRQGLICRLASWQGFVADLQRVLKQVSAD